MSGQFQVAGKNPKDFSPNVRLSGLGRFDPKPDITAFELAQIMNAFWTMELSGGYVWERAAIAPWFKERGLDRHFSE